MRAIRQQPTIQRPTIDKRREQSPGGNNGQIRIIRITDRGPILVGEINVRNRKRSQYKSYISRIELSIKFPGKDLSLNARLSHFSRKRGIQPELYFPIFSPQGTGNKTQRDLIKCCKPMPCAEEFKCTSTRQTNTLVSLRKL